MNILHLEDEGDLTDFCPTLVNEKGHTVFQAYNILAADSYWQSESIDCIVLDLNLSSEGLTKDEKTRTGGGRLSGWVWLVEHVFPTSPDMRRHTIICSGFLDVLRTTVGEDRLHDIRQIKKGKPGAARDLMRYFDDVAKLPKPKVSDQLAKLRTANKAQQAPR